MVALIIATGLNNFICEAEDCGAPMDILIKIDKNGLPNIIN